MINHCVKDFGDRNQEILWNHLSSLRNRMAYYLQGVWGYFYTDVLEVQWKKLTDTLGDMGQQKLQILSPNENGDYPEEKNKPHEGRLKEFEDLRRAIKSYLEAIYVQTFLNFPQIILSIFKIIEHCKTLCAFVEILEAKEKQIYDMESQIKELYQEFDNDVTFFIRLIDNLNQAGSSQFLSQLLMRINYNDFYKLVDLE